MTDIARSTAASRGRDVSADAIRDWLAGRVAYYLERPGAEVDVDAALVELGMDSVYVLTLCGDIEERYGLAVEATLPWDYPTVTALAGYLAQQLATA